MIFGRNRRNLNELEFENWKSSLKDFGNIVLTFLLVSLAWIFFRAENVTAAFQYFLGVFDLSCFTKMSLKEALILWGIPEHNFWNLLILVLGALIFEWFNRRNQHGLSQFKVPTILRYLVYFTLIFLITENFHGERTFIYFQF